MFDVDGTLVDSTSFDEACFLKAAEFLFGIEISSDWDSYKYATDIGILNEAIDRYSIPGDKNSLIKEFRNIFLELISEYIGGCPGCISEIPGASEFLKDLRERKNCRIAIATGGWEETAKLKLKAAGVDIDIEQQGNNEIEYQDEKEYLQSLLKKLPQDEQNLLFMRYRVGLTHKEIASMIDIPEGTIRRQCAAILNKLKQQWQKDSDAI